MAIGNTMVGFNKITRSAEVLIRCESTPRTIAACSAGPAAVGAVLAAAVEAPLAVEAAPAVKASLAADVRAAPATAVETAPAAASEES